MKMNKAELESQVQSLEATLTAYEVNLDTTKKALTTTKERLASINKPIITNEVLDELRDLIHQCLTNYDFDDLGNYEYDFELDYNNQISLSSLTLNSFDDLLEDIGVEIESCFNILDVNDITDTSN